MVPEALADLDVGSQEALVGLGAAEAEDVEVAGDDLALTQTRTLTSPRSRAARVTRLLWRGFSKPASTSQTHQPLRGKTGMKARN